MSSFNIDLFPFFPSVRPISPLSASNFSAPTKKLPTALIPGTGQPIYFLSSQDGLTAGPQLAAQQGQPAHAQALREWQEKQASLENLAARSQEIAQKQKSLEALTLAHQLSQNAHLNHIRTTSKDNLKNMSGKFSQWRSAI